MGKDLQGLYQQVRETPALAVDFPEKYGKGRISRLDTGDFSLSSWEMQFSRDTLVEGNVTGDIRLFFCLGEGVEWRSDGRSMNLDRNEACFTRSAGSTEKMCYHRNAPFSFFSVSVPVDRFSELIGHYLPDPDSIVAALPGRRFPISAVIQKSLHDIGSLESVHSGFDRMRLEAHIQGNVAHCLQAALCEQIEGSRIHRDDLDVIRAVGARIEDNPVSIPNITTLAHECCMSVSKLTRTFRQVYGVSLHAYVIEMRLQKGAECLAQDGVSIREIAERLGYMKPSQFSADFRKRFGVLPGQYRSGSQ